MGCALAAKPLYSIKMMNNYQEIILNNNKLLYQLLIIYVIGSIILYCWNLFNFII